MHSKKQKMSSIVGTSENHTIVWRFEVPDVGNDENEEPLSAAGNAFSTPHDVIDTDVTFYLGPKRVPVHVGKEQSSKLPSVFSMFVPPGFVKIEFPEFDPDTFKMLLQTIWSGAWPSTVGWSEALDIYSIAKHLQLSKVATLALHSIIDATTAETAISILEHGVKIKDEIIQRVALETIDGHAEVIMNNNDTAKNLTRDALAAILVRDSVDAEEYTLFMAAIAWAAARVHDRSFYHNFDSYVTACGDELRVNNLLHFIRFPLMSCSQALRSYGAGILCDEDTWLELIDYVECKERRGPQKRLPDTTPFSTKNRVRQQRAAQAVESTLNHSEPTPCFGIVKDFNGDLVLDNYLDRQPPYPVRSSFRK